MFRDRRLNPCVWSIRRCVRGLSFRERYRYWCRREFLLLFSTLDVFRCFRNRRLLRRLLFRLLFLFLLLLLFFLLRLLFLELYPRGLLFGIEFLGDRDPFEFLFIEMMPA